MDGHGRKTCCLRHTSGCPSCRRRKKDTKILAHKITDDSVDRGRFPRSGSAGDQKNGICRRFCHRLALERIKSDLLFLLQAGNLFFHLFSDGSIPRSALNLRIQIQEHPGNILLSSENTGQIDFHLRGRSRGGAADAKAALHRQIFHLNEDFLCRKAEKGACSLHKDLLRQKAVSLTGSQKQRI